MVVRTLPGNCNKILRMQSVAINEMDRTTDNKLALFSGKRVTKHQLEKVIARETVKNNKSFSH